MEAPVVATRFAIAFMSNWIAVKRSSAIQNVQYSSRNHTHVAAPNLCTTLEWRRKLDRNNLAIRLTISSSPMRFTNHEWTCMKLSTSSECCGAICYTHLVSNTAITATIILECISSAFLERVGLVDRLPFILKKSSSERQLFQNRHRRRSVFIRVFSKDSVVTSISGSIFDLTWY